MKERNIRRRTLVFMLLAALAMSGCSAAGNEDAANSQTPGTARSDRPVLPEKLRKDADGVPQLEVYQVDEEETQEMDIETYLLGVLAGEMKNDWPLEALKAQAILARTFVLKFCTEKESKYEGADISTDIEEAQAYDATGINERIEQAVKETRGMVLSYGGELPYAWFHAHSGGMTARAREGLGYEKAEPGYTKVTDGKESARAPQDAQTWSASFSLEEVRQAAQKSGLSGLETIETIAVGERGESGRAVTLLLNGQSVSASELRIALGSARMRSTLLTSLKVENGRIMMSGKGYGHGVGMPQWGAYGMAEEGKTAEEIVRYYFQDVTVETLW